MAELARPAGWSSNTAFRPGTPRALIPARAVAPWTPGHGRRGHILIASPIPDEPRRSMEQRYHAMLEVLVYRLPVTEVADRYGCPASRCTPGSAAIREIGLASLADR